MSEHIFKLFDKLKARSEREECVSVECEHSVVIGGVCDQCFEIVFIETVNDEDFYNHTLQRNGGGIKYKLDNFYNKHCATIEVCNDYEKFVIAYNGLEKSRKNFLLNKWVCWQLMTRRGLEGKMVNIKNLKSRREHEDLCQRVFDNNHWGLISL